MKKKITYTELVEKNKAEILKDQNELRKIELRIDQKRIERAQ